MIYVKVLVRRDDAGDSTMMRTVTPAEIYAQMDGTVKDKAAAAAVLRVLADTLDPQDTP